MGRGNKLYIFENCHITYYFEGDSVDAVTRHYYLRGSLPQRAPNFHVLPKTPHPLGKESRAHVKMFLSAI